MRHSRFYRPIVTLMLATLGVCALFLLLSPFRVAVAGGTVGNGTPGSCTESALDAALDGGGYVTFNCGGPATIVITSAGSEGKVITADTIIDGDGLITISGGGLVRVFTVKADVSLTLIDLTVSNGRVYSSDGGAIHNSGVLSVISSTIAFSRIDPAFSGRGGGIYNSGVTTVTNSTFRGNSARIQSGIGGGGGIYNAGSLTIVSATFDSNQALGASLFATENVGGGGLYNAGSLTLISGTFIRNASIRGYDSAFSEGAGVYNAGTALISATTFVSNTSQRNGGGLANGSTGQATLYNVAWIGNTSSDRGGGLFNNGIVMASDSLFTGNEGGVYGGGLYNGISGTLTLTNSSLVSNTALTLGTYASGGGLMNEGTAFITGGAVSGNDSLVSGNGIENAGSLVLSGTLVVGNAGLGLRNENRGRVVIANSTIASHPAGGITNEGALTVTHSAIVSNTTSGDGGGIFNSTYDSTNRLTLDHVTLRNNTATGAGGGLYSSSGQPRSITILNSAIYSNTASSAGGLGGSGTFVIRDTAVYNNAGGGILILGGSTLDLSNSTISGNSGAGVQASSATLDYVTIVSNTIGLQGSPYTPIGNSILAFNGTDCTGAAGSVGYNLVKGNFSTCYFAPGSDLLGIDPQLGPLQDNGGATWTQALSTNSPALDAANPYDCPGADQIGTLRPQPSGGRCDIGAYERPVRRFQFSSSAYAVDENAGAAIITATYGTAPASTPLTVTVQSTDDTAIAGSDYAAISRTLIFPPGMTTLTFTVLITDDLLIENDEALTLTLRDPVGIALGSPYSATLIILDNEPRARFSSPAYSVGEASGPAIITLTLNPAAGIPISINVRTTDGSASSINDYAAVSRTLTFAPGATVLTTTIPITDDVLSEANETISLTMSVPGGASLGLSSAVLTIMDDEPVTANVNTHGDLPDTNPGDGLCDSDTSSADAQCTLRAAIQEANLRPGSDTITFSITGTIVLTGSLPPITDVVNIAGPGAAALTVNANDAGRHLTFVGLLTGQPSAVSGLTLLGGAGDLSDLTFGGGALHVGSGVQLAMSNMVITGNHAYRGGFGGGIWSNGALTVSDSLIANNWGTYGGGLYIVTGTAALSHTIVSGNTTAYSGGGGIANAGGTLSLWHSTLRDNSTTDSSGGGLGNGATAALFDSEIYSNTAAHAGGGIMNSGSLTVTHTQVMSNTANGNGGGGGIYNLGTLTLDQSALHDNFGVRGGSLTNDESGQAALARSVIDHNTALFFGGGIMNYGALTTTNMTVGRNRTLLSTASSGGGGVYNLSPGALWLENTTVAENTAAGGDGGGLYAASGNVTLRNTLIASNTVNSGGPDITGTITSLGYNLISRNNGASGLIGMDISGTIALPLDPKMAAFDGEVYALLRHSPAIDAADPIGCPLTDQRGSARPIGPRCDIGAFEFNAPTITGPLTTTGTVGQPFAYTIIASGSQPITFTTSALPTGLTLNGAIISGTPAITGTTNVTLTATNAVGSDAKTLVITIYDALLAPTITSALAVTGTVGQPFAYTITASGSQPITFTTSALPTGLTLTGALISGTPAVTGTTNVTLTATNIVGSDTRTLVITIRATYSVYLPLVVR